MRAFEWLEPRIVFDGGPIPVPPLPLPLKVGEIFLVENFNYKITKTDLGFDDFGGNSGTINNPAPANPASEITRRTLDPDSFGTAGSSPRLDYDFNRVPGGQTGGCQYTSDAYQRILKTLGIQCSMSRTGYCYDNAVMERFFWSLKHEWTKHQRCADLDAMRLGVFRYIETFYNPLRLHQTLGYHSPNHYEADHAPATAAQTFRPAGIRKSWAIASAAR